MAALKITGKGAGRRDRHFYVAHPKVVGTGTLVVSKDGNTLTISGKGTDEKGKTYGNVVVYDKQ